MIYTPDPGTSKVHPHTESVNHTGSTPSQVEVRWINQLDKIELKHSSRNLQLMPIMPVVPLSVPVAVLQSTVNPTRYTDRIFAAFHLKQYYCVCAF
jgi:hypothetical protein